MKNKVAVITSGVGSIGAMIAVAFEKERKRKS